MTAQREGIAALEALRARYRPEVINISGSSVPVQEGLVHVRFRLGSRFWEVFVIDEYNDFRESRKLLSLYMVLDALRDYDICEDYLEWCRDYEVDPASEVFRSYHMSFGNTYHEIKAILGDFYPILKQIHFRFPLHNKKDSQALLKEY